MPTTRRTRRASRSPAARRRSRSRSRSSSSNGVKGASASRSPPRSAPAGAKARRRLATALTVDTNSSLWEHAATQHQPVEDITLPFFYKPHHIALLAAGLLLLGYYALFSEVAEASPSVTNVRSGLAAAMGAWLVVGAVVLPNGPFVRPHPTVWRLVLAVNILYLCIIVFALFQKKDDIHAALRFFNPKHTPKEQQPDTSAEDYGGDCAVSAALLWSRVDRFFLAHFIGWVAKAVMLRNIWLCWIISIGWEISEMCFASLLPNFNECWWDQWVYDVLLANGLGIYVGVRLCRWLDMRAFEWHGVREIPTMRGKIKRSLQQFTPVSWTLVEWDPFLSARRYLSVTFVSFCVMLPELNAFFLKWVFGVHSADTMNFYRLWLVALCGTPSMRQLYVYMTDPACKTLGTQAWVGAAAMIAELLVCVKFGRGMFPLLGTLEAVGLWVVGVTAVCVGSLFVLKRLNMCR